MSATIGDRLAQYDYWGALQLALGKNGGTIKIDYSGGQQAATLNGAPISQPAGDVVSFSDQARQRLAASNVSAGIAPASAAALPRQRRRMRRSGWPC